MSCCSSAEMHLIITVRGLGTNEGHNYRRRVKCQ